MFESRLPLTPTDTDHPFNRSTLVLATLGVSSCNALLVAIAIPFPLLNQLAGIALVIYLALAAMVWGLGAVSFAAHALVVCSFCVFATLASQTGGINSPAVVWMPILSIAALLLINLRWAMVWMGLIVVHNVLQFTAVQAQWIEGHVDATVIPESIAFWIRTNVLVFVMVALGLYEAMFRRSSKSLALRNLEMEALQAARQEAQNHIDALIQSLDQYLRAPIQKIASLQNHLQVHPSSTLTPTPPQIRDVAEKVVALVTQVLEIAQYETDRLALKQTPFSVREAVREAALTPAGGFAAHAVTLTPQAQGIAPTAPERKPWRFLLVDDQPKRLSKLQSVVHLHWPSAILGQSDSGESALPQLEFSHYDMVLIALHMQAMDGLETVRRMRQHAKAPLRDVPVIGLCDQAFAHQRQRYLAAGMQWLLFSPWQGEQLARMIQLHLPEEVL